MQTVRIAAPLHDTARLLVHDLDRSVHHHVLHVLFKERVSLQQLVDAVDTAALDAEIAVEFLLGLGFFGFRPVGVFDLGRRLADVGHDEVTLVVVVLRKERDTPVGELNAVVALVDGVVQLLVDQRHQAVVVPHVIVFCLLQQALVVLLAQELDQGTVLGRAAEYTQQFLGSTFVLFGVIPVALG